MVLPSESEVCSLADYRPIEMIAYAMQWPIGDRLRCLWMALYCKFWEHDTRASTSERPHCITWTSALRRSSPNAVARTMPIM